MDKPWKPNLMPEDMDEFICAGIGVKCRGVKCDDCIVGSGNEEIADWLDRLSKSLRSSDGN